MADTPRRDRTPAPPPVLTKEQVEEAIARVGAGRRRTVRDPADVHGQALHPVEAQRMTGNWRFHTRWYRFRRSAPDEPDP